VFSNLSLLNRLEEPWKADAARKPETKTSGVDWRVSLKSCGLAKSVVGLAEGDTRAAACDQASINRIEASEERARPAVWASGWLGDNLWLVDGILESSDPGVYIIWVNSSSGCGCVLLRSRHCWL